MFGYGRKKGSNVRSLFIWEAPWAGDKSAGVPQGWKTEVEYEKMQSKCEGTKRLFDVGRPVSEMVL